MELDAMVELHLIQDEYLIIVPKSPRFRWLLCACAYIIVVSICPLEILEDSEYLLDDRDCPVARGCFRCVLYNNGAPRLVDAFESAAYRYGPALYIHIFPFQPANLTYTESGAETYQYAHIAGLWMLFDVSHNPLRLRLGVPANARPGT